MCEKKLKLHQQYVDMIGHNHPGVGEIVANIQELRATLDFIKIETLEIIKELVSKN